MLRKCSLQTVFCPPNPRPCSLIQLPGGLHGDSRPRAGASDGDASVSCADSHFLFHSKDKSHKCGLRIPTLLSPALFSVSGTNRRKTPLLRSLEEEPRGLSCGMSALAAGMAHVPRHGAGAESCPEGAGRDWGDGARGSGRLLCSGPCRAPTRQSA